MHKPTSNIALAETSTARHLVGRFHVFEPSPAHASRLASGLATTVTLDSKFYSEQQVQALLDAGGPLELQGDPHSKTPPTLRWPAGLAVDFKLNLRHLRVQIQPSIDDGVVGFLVTSKGQLNARDVIFESMSQDEVSLLELHKSAVLQGCAFNRVVTIASGVGSRVTLDECTVRGCGEGAGLSAYDQGRLEITNSAIENAGIGIFVHAGDVRCQKLSIRSCGEGVRVEGIADFSVNRHAGGKLVLEHTAVLDCGVAYRAAFGGQIAAKNARITGCARAVVLASGARVRIDNGVVEGTGSQPGSCGFFVENADLAVAQTTISHFLAAFKIFSSGQTQVHVFKSAVERCDVAYEANGRIADQAWTLEVSDSPVSACTKAYVVGGCSTLKIDSGRIENCSVGCETKGRAQALVQDCIFLDCEREATAEDHGGVLMTQQQRVVCNVGAA